MIWERFPKFVLGFVVASLLFSFVPSSEFVDSTRDLMRGLRTWWFALAFVSIGLETRFRDLVSMEQGRPAIAFLLGQGANIVRTLLISSLLFGASSSMSPPSDAGPRRSESAGKPPVGPPVDHETPRQRATRQPF